MKLTLEQAAQILGISALLLRWRIRHPCVLAFPPLLRWRSGHHRVLAFVERKPATVELATVLKCKTTMVNPSSNAGRPR